MLSIQNFQMLIIDVHLALQYRCLLSLAGLMVNTVVCIAGNAEKEKREFKDMLKDLRIQANFEVYCVFAYQ